MTPEPLSPPVAPVEPHVHDQHGVPRPDPYFWLKDKLSQRSLDYLRAERSYYDAVMAPLSDLTTELTAEMTSRVTQGEDSARWREGDYEYFTRTCPGLEYEQLWRVGADGVEKLVLDENLLTGQSSYVGLGVRLVSPDGDWLAYSVDTDGDEVYELRFRNLTTGADVAQAVVHTYYGGGWAADSRTFFYVVHDEAYRPYQVWRHSVGTPTGDNTLVFEETDPQYDVNVWSDRAGDYIVLHTANRNTTEVRLISSRNPQEPPRIVAPRRPGIEYSVAHLPETAQDSLLIVTNDQAREFRLVRAPITSTDPADWKTVVGEQPDERIHDVDIFDGHVVVSTVREGRQLLRLMSWSTLGKDRPFADSIVVEPGSPGALLTLGANEEFAVSHVLIEVESYVRPLEWHQVELSTGQRTVVKRRDVPNYDADHYVLEERWVDATDGERIPVRLVRAKHTALDGTAPLMLYGYGAYESSFWPGFETWLPSLLDRGFVFVHAGIRGGGEMGRRWWLDGCMHRKTNTFTDFIDVADRLAADGLINGDRIVSRGLSAGGLLQGAVFSMRPDRWRAVIAEVPFVDVVTTMFDLEVPLTAGELDEWGDPRSRKDFDYLSSYAPYENVPTGPRPELLVTGAVHDPRVMVHEPAKWVAKLRATDDGGSRKTLFRVETGEGGHTGPPGRYAHLSYEAEVAAFSLNVVAE
ncbi:MAG TPA: prolyl oligopeptidase family serine peptidase [Actinomycetes bacterium]|nr:prolyl oligopeptidase family serine peptidase [Actinomycetes bacterium]